MIKAALLCISILFSISGCINVAIGGGAPKRATDVRFTEPSGSFEKESRADVDASWRHKKNGNAISYVSDCQDGSDPELDTIASGVFSGLSQVKFDRNEKIQYRQREAKRILARGQVDGVPTMIDLLVFKRNRCIYILSYVSLDKTFASNSKDFDAFITGFNPP